MSVLKNPIRYELLAKQFHIEKTTFINRTLKESHDRIFSYIYCYTDIYYLKDIDSTTLYDYIKFQSMNQNKKSRITEVIKDIKYFLLFLRKYHQLKINLNLSLNNLALWSNIGGSQVRGQKK